MRLLHTQNLTFSEFFDKKIPPYAILSHRWGDDEVSYQEFLKRRNKRSWRLKNKCSWRLGNDCSWGWTKITQACHIARHSPGGTVYDWIWIDTCCINKESSAELSEAINSMFAWYQNAGNCFVFLFNRPNERQSGTTTRAQSIGPDLASASIVLESSDWFSRGWTLQEILAGARIDFFDSNFAFLGSKKHLCEAISGITGIAKHYLSGRRNIRMASIATRMSWAARRCTTRQEDVAYCLLGIFDVNMPLLYGEGMKAFQRLQFEIIRQSDDESIFAWSSNEDAGIFHTGILATSPALFAEASDIGPLMPNRRPPYALTNKGLEFKIPASELAVKLFPEQSDWPGPKSQLSISLSCGATFPGSGFRTVIIRLARFPRIARSSESWFRESQRIEFRDGKQGQNQGSEHVCLSGLKDLDIIDLDGGSKVFETLYIKLEWSPVAEHAIRLHNALEMKKV